MIPANGNQGQQDDAKGVQASTKITRIFDLLGGANSNAARIAELSRSINVALLGPEAKANLPDDDEAEEMGLLDRILACLYETQAILSASIGKLEEVDKQLKL